MTIPIWKDCPEMDGLMNIQDAKELFSASAEIQKFIEYVSQSLSRKISSKLYTAKELLKACPKTPILNFIEDTSQTHSKKIAANLHDSIAKDGIGFYECVFATSVIEAYAKEYHCEIKITHEILSDIAMRIASLFREKEYTVEWYTDNECAYLEISGWDEK